MPLQLLYNQYSLQVPPRYGKYHSVTDKYHSVTDKYHSVIDSECHLPSVIVVETESGLDLGLSPHLSSLLGQSRSARFLWVWVSQWGLCWLGSVVRGGRCLSACCYSRWCPPVHQPAWCRLPACSVWPDLTIPLLPPGPTPVNDPLTCWSGMIPARTESQIPSSHGLF